MELVPLHEARNIHDTHDTRELADIALRNSALIQQITDLTCAQQLILLWRYWYGATLSETAYILGVCTERARQLEARAIRQLRHPKRIRKLFGYPHIEESVALHIRLEKENNARRIREEHETRERHKKYLHETRIRIYINTRLRTEAEETYAQSFQQQYQQQLEQEKKLRERNQELDQIRITQHAAKWNGKPPPPFIQLTHINGHYALYAPPSSGYSISREYNPIVYDQWLQHLIDKIHHGESS